MPWKILEVAYKGNIHVRQVPEALIREFEHMEMDEKEGVVEFIAQVQKIANRLEMNGEEMPPNRITEKILKNLTNDFESIVVTIKDTHDLSTLTLEELVGLLKAHELKKKKKRKESDYQALHAHFDSNATRNTQSQSLGGRGRVGRGRGGSGRSDNEFCTHETGHQDWCGRGRARGRGGRSKTSVECFKCGKHGQYANKCRSRKCCKYGKPNHIATDENPPVDNIDQHEAIQAEEAMEQDAEYFAVSPPSNEALQKGLNIMSHEIEVLRGLITALTNENTDIKQRIAKLDETLAKHMAKKNCSDMQAQDVMSKTILDAAKGPNPQPAQRGESLQALLDKLNRSLAGLQGRGVASSCKASSSMSSLLDWLNKPIISEYEAGIMLEKVKEAMKTKGVSLPVQLTPAALRTEHCRSREAFLI